MKAISLFAGIGGFDLAIERVGGSPLAFVEIDPFCQAVLRKHWPDVPLYEDVRSFDPEPFRGRVDLVCGGFPCQDVSAAGKGAGIGGARSGLWREMARIISGVRPRWCLIENVPALRTRGADRVLADLEEIGYDAWPLVVGAWAVGAPHKRDRVWIVANARHGNDRTKGRAEPNGRAIAGGEADELADADRSGRRGQAVHLPERESRNAVPDAIGAGQDLADAADVRQERPERASDSWSSGRFGAIPTSGERSRWPARPGEPQHEWEEPRLVAYSESVGRKSERKRWREEGGGWAYLCDSCDKWYCVCIKGQPQQPLGTPADGLPARLVRLARRANREALKAAGNSIVPQVAEAVLRAMLNAATRSEKASAR